MTRRRSRLTDVLDPAGFSDAGLTQELAAIGRLRSQLAAYEAALVADFAGRRPASGTGGRSSRGIAWRVGHRG